MVGLHGGLDLTTNQSQYQDDDDDDDGPSPGTFVCKWATLRTYPPSGEHRGEIDVRVVEAPGARVGDRSVRGWRLKRLLVACHIRLSPLNH